MKSAGKLVLAVVLAAGVGLAVWFLLVGPAEPDAPQPDEPHPVAKAAERSPKVPAGVRTNRVKKVAAGQKKDGARTKDRKTVRVLAQEEDRSPADRKLSDAVQAALDGDDFKAVRAAAAQALQSTNAVVRQEAVAALGWFGDKALVDLTKALVDKDPEVAEAARGQVEQALMGMEDAHMAFVTASSYVQLYGGDREASTMLLGIMESTGSRLTDPDDADSLEDVKKTRGWRADIVTAIAALVEQGGDLAVSARETYERIADAKWIDRSAAEKWAADIPDPEPPEEAEEAAETF